MVYTRLRNSSSEIFSPRTGILTQIDIQPLFFVLSKIRINLRNGPVSSKYLSDIILLSPSANRYADKQKVREATELTKNVCVRYVNSKNERSVGRVNKTNLFLLVAFLTH